MKVDTVNLQKLSSFIEKVTTNSGKLAKASIVKCTLCVAGTFLAFIVIA